MDILFRYRVISCIFSKLLDNLSVTHLVTRTLKHAIEPITAALSTRMTNPLHSLHICRKTVARPQPIMSQFPQFMYAPHMCINSN